MYSVYVPFFCFWTNTFTPIRSQEFHEYDSLGCDFTREHSREICQGMQDSRTMGGRDFHARQLQQKRPLPGHHQVKGLI